MNNQYNRQIKTAANASNNNDIIQLAQLHDQMKDSICCEIYHDTINKTHIEDDQWFKNQFTETSFKQLPIEQQRQVELALTIIKKNKDLIFKQIAYDLIKSISESINTYDPEIIKLYQNQAQFLNQQILNPEFSPKQQRILYDEIEQIYLPENLTDEIYLSYKQEDRWAERTEALLETQNQNYKQSQKHYQLDSEVTALLHLHGINPNQFCSLYGTSYQHQINKELISILEQSPEYYHQQKQLISHLFEFADLASSGNHSEKVALATNATNVCWNIFEYAEAIALGCYDTACNAVNIIQDPIAPSLECAQSMLDILQTINTTAKHFVLDYSAYEKDCDKIQLFYKGLKKAWNESTGPQRVRIATHLITDQILTNKALATCGKFIDIAAVSSQVLNEAKQLEKTARTIKSAVKKLQETDCVMQTEVGNIMVNFMEHEATSITPKAVAPINSVKKFPYVPRPRHRVLSLRELKEIIEIYGFPFENIALQEQIQFWQKRAFHIPELEKEIVTLTKKYGRLTTLINGEEFTLETDVRHILGYQTSFSRKKQK